MKKIKKINLIFIRLTDSSFENFTTFSEIVVNILFFYYLKEKIENIFSVNNKNEMLIIDNRTKSNLYSQNDFY